MSVIFQFPRRRVGEPFTRFIRQHIIMARTYRDLCERYAKEALSALPAGAEYYQACEAVRLAAPQLSGGNPAEVRIWAEESRKALRAWRDARKLKGQQKLF